MGKGSAIAQAAADLLLLNDSLDVVATAVATSRRMLQVVRQNLRWALLYNGAAVPLAALDLVPPWLAALGMSASSLVVVLNARRLAGKVTR
jgi:Cu2+-exporting ATPase